jgi:hypothetical protein
MIVGIVLPTKEIVTASFIVQHLEGLNIKRKYSWLMKVIILGHGSHTQLKLVK